MFVNTQPGALPALHDDRFTLEYCALGIALAERRFDIMAEDRGTA
jgi:hypothetical protein